MIAEFYNLDGCLQTHGQYTPLTKSLVKAAIDAMHMFNGDEMFYSHHFMVVKIGNGRIVISR